jgi:CRISPR/Cas system-associated exonuclease Cas4 (RecB family)
MKIKCPDGSIKDADDCVECHKCLPKPLVEMLLKGRNRKKKKRDKPRFGVTRLVGGCLRKTYYDLTEEAVFTLEKMWIFNRGTAIHEFVQKDMPKEDIELFMEKKFSTFAVIGFVDAVHRGALYEFKTTANIPQEPQEAHILQAQAYYSMLSEAQRAPIKKLLIIYFSMHKIKVFEVKPRNVLSYLEARGTILTNAIKIGKAPKREESYICNYCDFKDICRGHKPPTYDPTKREEEPKKDTTEKTSAVLPAVSEVKQDTTVIKETKAKQFDIFSFD